MSLQKIVAFIFLLALVSLTACVEIETLSQGEKAQLSQALDKINHQLKAGEVPNFDRFWSREVFTEINNLSAEAVEEFLGGHQGIVRPSKFPLVPKSAIQSCLDKNGKVDLVAEAFEETSLQTTYLLAYEDGFDLLKYKFQLQKGLVYLMDVYDFKSKAWLSDQVRQLENRINDKAFVSDQEKLKAFIGNKNLKDADEGMKLIWLEQLKGVSKETQKIQKADQARLGLAEELGLEVFVDQIEYEYNLDPDNYTNYLYSLYFQDSTVMNKLRLELYESVNNKLVVDTLLDNPAYWHH